MRKLGVLFAFVLMLVAVPVANAAVTDVFNGKIPCNPQGNGQIHCSGPGGANHADEATVNSWDGSPIDVNVGLPDPTEFGNGPYPMAMYFHGFGGSKEGFGGDLQRFLNQGIAVFSMTERGFRNSCGTQEAIDNLVAAGRNCDNGFIHLMDTRYEVRDAQYLMGILVDQGLAKPDKIGTVGASYGGGKSMALAALKDRVMKPDGSYMPWKSPNGTPLKIAAAAPIVPWTDFAYSLLPNGRTLDYVKDAPYQQPYGVMKSGIISALLPSGDNFSGQHGYPVNPEFDILGWKAAMEQGEPYVGSPVAEQMFTEMTTHHSSYYIDDSVQPAPMLIAQGFTDDLFPIDEPLRYYNRTKAKYPNSDISLLFADIGHPRAPLGGQFAQGREEDKEMGFVRVDAWFSHYLKQQGPKPVNQVEVKTQVCPYETPSGGPYTAANWADMSPGEIRFRDPASRIIAADGGLDLPALTFNILNGGCVQTDEVSEPGAVEYDLGTVPTGGLTLMGAPTVIADVSVANGSDSQIAARLLEIDDGGMERLVARGLYRPDASGPQVIQLHGNGYKFDAGTKMRLQLLPKDGLAGLGLVSYSRPSNDQRNVTIKSADIRIPVQEKPGAAGGLVQTPAPKVLPAGAELAGDYDKIGSVTIDEWARGDAPVVVKVAGAPKVKGKKLTVKIKCAIGNDSCAKTSLKFKGAPKKGKKGKNLLVAKGSGFTARPGQTKTVSLKLTAKARKFFKDKKVRKRGKKKTIRGAKSLRIKVLVGGKSAGFKTVKRVGKVK